MEENFASDLNDLNIDISDITSDVTPEFLKEHKIDEMISSFAEMGELYSVLLDTNGRMLLTPTGPTAYLGEFHEIISNPKYHAKYMDNLKCLNDTKKPMYEEIDDGNPHSRLSTAPIFVNGSLVATWVMYSRTEQQTMRLFKAHDRQRVFAEALSELITRLTINSRITDNDKQVQSELEFEHEAKLIIEEILDVLSKGDKKNIYELYERVGRLLDVDYIVYYEFDFDHPGKMNLKDYWAKIGKGDEAEQGFVWDHDHYSPDVQDLIKQDCFILDSKSMTNRMRVEVFGNKTRAIMVFPVFIGKTYTGRLIFIESSKERVWTDEEISFARDVTDFISRNLTIEKRMGVAVMNRKTFKAMLEAMPVMAMIRSVKTGKILFANSAMRERLGEEIVGQDSYQILPKASTTFKDLEKMTEHKHRPVTFTRYIEKLGGIYNIIESSLDKYKDERCKVVLFYPE